MVILIQPLTPVDVVNNFNQESASLGNKFPKSGVRAIKLRHESGPTHCGHTQVNSAPHMHVLVCICSNVRQFHTVELIIQLSFRAQMFFDRPCFVGHNRWPAFYYNRHCITCRPLLQAGAQSARLVRLQSGSGRKGGWTGKWQYSTPTGGAALRVRCVLSYLPVHHFRCFIVELTSILNSCPFIDTCVTQSQTLSGCGDSIDKIEVISY